MSLTDLDTRRDWFLSMLRDKVSEVPEMKVALTFTPDAYVDNPTAFVWLGAERILPGSASVSQGESVCDFAVWVFFETVADVDGEGLLDMASNKWAHNIERQLREMEVASKTIDGATYSIASIRVTEIVPGFLDESRKGLVEVKGQIAYRIF